MAQSLSYTDPNLLPKRKAAPFSLRTSRFTSQAVAAGKGSAWSLDPAQHRGGMQEPSLLSGCLCTPGSPRWTRTDRDSCRWLSRGRGDRCSSPGPGTPAAVGCGCSRIPAPTEIPVPGAAGRPLPTPGQVTGKPHRREFGMEGGARCAPAEPARRGGGAGAACQWLRCPLLCPHPTAGPSASPADPPPRRSVRTAQRRACGSGAAPLRARRCAPPAPRREPPGLRDARRVGWHAGMPGPRGQGGPHPS